MLLVAEGIIKTMPPLQRTTQVLMNQHQRIIRQRTAEATYKAQCVGCHAADMSGGVGPNLQKIGGKLTVEQISTQIHNGGGGMPAYKGTLTEDQITALTDWLAAKK